MNKAQKRTWLSFGISLATLLIAAAVIAFIRINQIDIYETTTYRLCGLFMTIPLISIVIISARFPAKKFDERDKLIDRKALTFGTIGVFIFLAGAGSLLTVTTKMGSIRASLIITLVYLACFVWILVSSVAALIQYGRGGKDGEK
ncbi:MAG: hypothetical protein ACYS0I_01790 [Planctomycetota bacterium]|jgi:hypothetical protein